MPPQSGPKRKLEDFDPNASDPNDSDFEEQAARPFTHRRKPTSQKKTNRGISRGHRRDKKRRRAGTDDSDIVDDDEDISEDPSEDPFTEESEEEEEELATIRLRDDGDLTLIVGEEKKRFLVDRRTISGVCKAWHTMFTKFAKATALEVELLDDDPEAIYIVLKIAHLKFNQLPDRKMTLVELDHLATICDKYDTLEIVRPFLEKWIIGWLDRDYRLDGNERFIWVAYIFGYEDAFKTLALQLRASFSINENGKCLTVNGAVLDDDHMPSELIGENRLAKLYNESSLTYHTEKMLKIRAETIDRLLSVCYAYIDQVEQEETCKAIGSKMRDQCHYLTLGSLIHGFRALEIWKVRKTALDIRQSIENFYNTVKEIKTSTMHEFPVITDIYGQQTTITTRTVDHGVCNPTSKLVADLEKVYRAVPTPVQDLQLERIGQQAKEGVPLSS